MEGPALGSQPKEGSNCEHMQGLLTNILQRHWGVTGRSPDRRGTRVSQIQHSFLGELGREDGVPRDQAFSGIKDSLFDRSSRSRGCGSVR